MAELSFLHFILGSPLWHPLSSFQILHKSLWVRFLCFAPATVMVSWWVENQERGFEEDLDNNPVGLRKWGTARSNRKVFLFTPKTTDTVHPHSPHTQHSTIRITKKKISKRKSLQTISSSRWKGLEWLRKLIYQKMEGYQTLSLYCEPSSHGHMIIIVALFSLE